MTSERYDSLCRLAGPHLREPQPFMLPLDEPPGWERAAVYICVNHQDQAVYAGQAVRHGVDGAVYLRMREHLRSASKRTEWAGYWVLPCHEHTTAQALTTLEKRVCATLMIPLVNRRWRTAEGQQHRFDLV